MWRWLAVLVVCPLIALAQGAEQPLLSIKGSVHTAGGGRAPIDTTMSISPVQARTVVNLKPGGVLELQALAARTYVVRVEAPGFGPITKEVDVDERGRGDLGALVLTPLRTLNVSVALAHHAALGSAPVERLEVRAGACLVVRASDDSGCRAQLCVVQEADRVSVQVSGGYLESVGAASVAELLSGSARQSSVFDRTVQLDAVNGRGAVLHHDDPFCRGIVRVDAMK